MGERIRLDGPAEKGSLPAAADHAASLHALAAGVAHEVNHPLAYVMGNLSFALGGLARVHAPAREGGEIEVTSAVGRGSTFRVKLSAADAADSPAGYFSANRTSDRPV